MVDGACVLVEEAGGGWRADATEVYVRARREGDGGRLASARPMPAVHGCRPSHLDMSARENLLVAFVPHVCIVHVCLQGPWHLLSSFEGALLRTDRLGRPFD